MWVPMTDKVGSFPLLRKQRKTVEIIPSDYNKWIAFISDKNDPRELTD